MQNSVENFCQTHYNRTNVLLRSKKNNTHPLFTTILTFFSGRKRSHTMAADKEKDKKR
jgi:hypothetical protein